MIVTILLALACVPDAVAQKRSTRKRSRPAQATAQTPQPPPAPPQRSQEELLYEKEIAALRALTPEQKTGIGEAIWKMDEAQRTWTLALDERRFRDTLRAAQSSINAADEMLPPGTLRRTIRAGWAAMLDSLTAYEFTLHETNVDAMMKIIDRYQLSTTVPVQVTAAVIKRAQTSIREAQRIAADAGIETNGTKLAAQVPQCTLTLAQAPAIRGFRLRMTLAEVRARFPTLQVKAAAREGYTDATIYAQELRGNTDFKGINRVTLQFLDNRITFIAVEYDDSVRWDSVDELLPSLTSSLGLPGLSAWRASFPQDDGGLRAKRLTCDGFQVDVWTLLNTQILFTDLATPEAQRIRQEKEKVEQEQKQRRDFKP
jgi:hypothetical protein